MHLTSIKYDEFLGDPREWILAELAIDKVVLIVGKNASGKTRSLNVISGLAGLISSERDVFSSGNYDVNFVDGANNYNYVLVMNEGQVVEERFSNNNEVLLERSQDGTGSLYATQINDRLRFKVPDNRLAIVAKRDEEQHSYLNPLHAWAENLIHHSFTDAQEKRTFITFAKEKIKSRHKHHPIGLLKKGIDRFGNEYIESIIHDFTTVGYSISDIAYVQPRDMEVVEGPLIYCLSVQEEELLARTDQNHMSDGMYRTLSLIIKLNYFLYEQSDSVLLVDDVGEGLDFGRAKNLVKLIIDKSVGRNIQIIMTTNDQFIMNGIPIDYWAISIRKGDKVSFVTHKTNPEEFERFKFIGLNNFEFFASEFYLDGV